MRVGAYGYGLTIVAAVVAGIAVSRPATAEEPQGLSVFAAASLTEAFTEIGRMMEQRDPTTKVSFNFAGSQQLATQIEQGAHADVFASADQAWMNHVQERNLLANAPQIFVGNRLAVVVPERNPGQIERLQDLGRAGIKVVMAAEVVPVGRYTREALEKLSRDPTFGSDFAAKVLNNVVSQEESVRGVLAKVQLGEADAGVVYRSDVTAAAAPALRVFDIPDPYNVEARYPIAIVKGTPSSKAAQTFVDLVLSPDGQRVLERFRFVPLRH